jgi:GNAT superfamily N-acetyltransferase
MGIAGSRLSYRWLHGKEIKNAVEKLAALRITVFRDFPYLYDGDIAYEKAYIQTYIKSQRSLLFAVFDGEKMVGATTCIPLNDETHDVQEPFLKLDLDLNEIFYFGESILLKEYRGLGIGNLFFEEREKHAFSYSETQTTCFCSVKRPIHHTLRPSDYQPLDDFWIKRGYIKSADLVSVFNWKDIGDPEPSNKMMEYWFKNKPLM